VAAALKLSPRTLHRVLASYGETFRRKLIDARLDVAVKMLESHLFDQVTTAEIGRRAGFSDASHFARVCRARFGCTPGQLRRARNDPQAEAADALPICLQRSVEERNRPTCEGTISVEGCGGEGGRCPWPPEVRFAEAEESVLSR
jgi:AraC-like DNA-binding protein